MLTIDLAPTRTLHDRLAGLLPARAENVRHAIEAANHSIRARGVTFGGEKDMPIALSALVLSESDRQALDDAGRRLHGILEKVLDWMLSSSTRLERYAADHRRIFPYLRKTPGSATWQLFSRYDAVVTPDGRVLFIECNTGCPAGFLHAVDFSRETRTALEAVGVIDASDAFALGMIRPDSLVDLLENVQIRSTFPPSPVAILTDENALKLELDLLVRALRDRGRQAAIIDARDLEFKDRRLRHEGTAYRVTFNKLRISTPESPNHCWKPGFEKRYEGLLSAIGADAVAPVNNLCALSVAEDKGVLALLFQDDARSILTADECRFIDEHVQWTARLRDGLATLDGRSVDLIPWVKANREAFVLKPANEGRGFEVHVGADTPQAEWERLCRPNSALPMVVQRFATPASFSIARLDAGCVRTQNMYLTIALAMVDGRYEGLLSRISTNFVTNVGRHGFVQAVFVRP